MWRRPRILTPFDAGLRAYSGQAVDILEATSEPVRGTQTGPVSALPRLSGGQSAVSAITAGGI